VLQTLKAWPSTHSVLFTVILFLLAAFISVYSQDIKRFLHDWPNTKEKIRKARERELTARLATLKTLHDDSYQLLLFVVWRVSKTSFEMAAFGMALFFVSLYLNVQLKPTMYLGYFLGSLVGLFGFIKGITVSLYKYDESVKEIEEKVARLRQPALVK
jgi:hypothetical protein